MLTEVVVERIPVAEGTLIICRRYMALQTPDGVLHPADLDEYGTYQPILELIRLLSYNADLSGEITEETRKDIVNVFSRIKYLPKKEPLQRIIHYAILAANSLIKNNNHIWLKLC